MATASPLDSAAFQRRLECPVCHEAYRRPRILPCGHTLCQVPCLEQIINDKPRFSCPECRSEHAVPESGPSGFPMNVAISRLTDDSRFCLQALPGCPICGEDVQLVKCYHCDLVICEECKIEHTPRFRKQLSQDLERFKQEIISKKSTCVSLEVTLKEQVKAITDLAYTDIEKASEEAIEDICQKVKQLKQKVQKFSEDENENIDFQRDETLRHLNKATEFCEVELKQLDSEGRLSHVSLAKIKNEYEKNSEEVSKHRLAMSTRRNITVHCKPMTPAIKDFCAVEIVQDKVTDQEANACKGEEVLNQTSIILEQTFTTPQLSIGSASKGPENLSEPVGIAVDPDSKDIFITDNENHRVQVFDRSGRHTFSFGSKGQGKEHFNYPSGILISRNSEVVVSDQGNHRVKVHGQDGSFIRAFGQKGSAPRMFNNPYGVAQDPDGNIHVCDIDNKRVQILTETGKFKGEYDSWILITDEQPWHISITASGQIGIQLDKTVVILNEKQQLLRHFPSNTVLSGICFVDDSHFFLSDPKSHKVRLYTSMGDLIRESGVPGICVGQLKKPRGIVIDGADVYVVCEGSSMVQKF